MNKYKKILVFMSIVFGLWACGDEAAKQIVPDGDADTVESLPDGDQSPAADGDGEEELTQADGDKLPADGDETPVAGTPGIRISPEKIDFGCVGVGDSSTRSLEIVNDSSGDVTIQIDSISLPQSSDRVLFCDGAQFDEDDTEFLSAPVMLDPAQSLVVSVEYAPLNCSFLDEVATVRYRFPGEEAAEIEVPLVSDRGKCAAGLVVDPESGVLDFGKVFVGENTVKTLRLSSDGDRSCGCIYLGALSIQQDSSQGGFAFDDDRVLLEGLSVMSSEGGYGDRLVQIHFSATAAGDYRAYMLISHNGTHSNLGSDSELVELTLLATAVNAPDGDLDAESESEAEMEAEMEAESELEDE